MRHVAARMSLPGPGGHRFGHLQAGKCLRLQQAALVLPGTAKGEILPGSLLSEQLHTQRWEFDCYIQNSLTALDPSFSHLVQ